MNGTFDLPECVPSECHILSFGNNTITSNPKRALHYQQTLQVSCIEGHRYTDGNITINITCLANGSLSYGALEDCRPVECLEPNVGNAAINSTASATGVYRYRDVITISCDPGYMLSNMAASVNLTCSENGAFEFQSVHCEKSHGVSLNPIIDIRTYLIAGGIVAGIVIFCLLIIAILFTGRRTSRNSKRHSAELPDVIYQNSNLGNTTGTSQTNILLPRDTPSNTYSADMTGSSQTQPSSLAGSAVYAVPDKGKKATVQLNHAEIETETGFQHECDSWPDHSDIYRESVSPRQSTNRDDAIEMMENDIYESNE
ncbi:uncharacterized protein LOC106170133 [Lingula anatina]|uniref:Uncharacterized protein LOC106170133 n=1 Tax=Lingula anatina TaxID=7574 RepID=A0A1S3J4L9_LINAN|nr:uncharacterized protein LOC106170133 [Lingula anatina]|eukprot:XP_013405330.1 uncharacterized protein LOC106170133 [Lingula anatina]